MEGWMVETFEMTAQQIASLIAVDELMEVSDDQET
jgi:hypothetical protein